MQVYYELPGGEVLCFAHAVQAVVEEDATITAHVDDVSTDPYDSMAGFVPVCCKCFPEEEELIP